MEVHDDAILGLARYPCASSTYGGTLAYHQPVEHLREFVRRPVVAVIAVGLLAAMFRFYHLGTPTKHVFDEAYYPKAGCLFVGYPRKECDVVSDDEKYWADRYNDVGSWVHPPVGKWMIGLGQLAFGPVPFGWRFSAAVAGTFTVVLVAIIAQLLFGSVVWTYTAGLLLATEHLNFVQSRTGMLDIFLAFWVIAGFLCLLLDRRWIGRRDGSVADAVPAAAIEERSDAEFRTEVEDPGWSELAPLAGSGARSATRTPAPVAVGATAVAEATPRIKIASPLLRPWRLAAGTALGLAIATKWSGVTAILAALILSYAWERTRRRARGIRHPVTHAALQESLGLVLSFLVLPAIVYVASWTGYFVWFGLDPVEWAKMQGAIVAYHRDLQRVKDNGKPIHPYLSSAWQWVLMARPVVYFYKESDGLRREIIGMGNPVIFWMSVVAIPYLAVAWRRARDWVAGFVLVAILAQYLPWFLVPRPQFLFYMTPITPFLVLAVVYLLRRLAAVRIEPGENDDETKRGARPWLPIVFGVVALSVIAFAWFWPVLTAGTLSSHAWSLRIWFDGSPWNAFNWV